MHARYFAYNLSIASEVDLPELAQRRGDASLPPDVIIRLNTASPETLASDRKVGPFLSCSPQGLWFRVPDVASFLVLNGNEIRIEPENGATAESIRLFLLGSAFGTLLLQRGFLVLHGNAIQMGDSCMVCLGDSGTGKSTLAARFMQRGFNVLADDIVPVDADCCAINGLPRIKLWQSAADKLNIETHDLARIHPSSAKFNLPFIQQWMSSPIPIRWIYILETAKVSDLSFEIIKGLRRFKSLYENTYRLIFLEGMELQPEHLRKCGVLASRARICRVTRPTKGFPLDELIDRLLLDMGTNFDDA